MHIIQCFYINCTSVYFIVIPIGNFTWIQQKTKFVLFNLRPSNINKICTKALMQRDLVKHNYYLFEIQQPRSNTIAKAL